MKPSAPPLIGYVMKMFPRLSETFILNEILELEQQGLSLHIFSLKRPTEPISEEARRVRSPITYLPDRPWREPLRVFLAHCYVLRAFPRGYGVAWIHILRGRFISLPRRWRRFSQTCCLIRDLGNTRHLHAHFADSPTRLASWVQMICQTSFSVTTHAKDLYRGNRNQSRGLQLKLGRTKFIVANSDWSAGRLRAVVASTPICTIYNGIDLRNFPFRQEEPAEPLILSVGRLVEKKGFSILIQACQQLKQWRISFRCEIIGAGPQEEELKDLIRKCGLDRAVILVGPMPYKEVRARYERAMVFALPCIQAPDGDRDILPNVLKEAMAVGVPVITSGLEAIEELITHGESGLLVPPGDPKTLATSLECLLTNAPLRRNLSARARVIVEERFDSRKNFVKLKELLLAAVTEKPLASPALHPNHNHESVA